MREPLDLETIALPRALPEVELPLTPGYVARVLASLGDAARSSRELEAAGFVPPSAVTGNTIHLVASHFDIAGGVYAREQVTYFRPLPVGEVLRVGGEIARTWFARGRRYRTMTSQSLGADAAPSVASRSTGVARYVARSDDAQRTAGRSEEEIATPGASAPLVPNPSRGTLSALQPGQRFEGRCTSVTLAMMRVLAGERDPNPIHTDPAFARREGLPAPIAGGPHVLAFVQELLMDALGPFALLHGAHFDVRWISPVRAESSILPRARVESIDAENVRLELSVLGEEREAMIGAAVIPLGPGFERSGSSR